MDCPTCGKLAQKNRLPNSDGQTYYCLTAACPNNRGFKARTCPCCGGSTDWHANGEPRSCSACWVVCRYVAKDEPCVVKTVAGG